MSGPLLSVRDREIKSAFVPVELMEIQLGKQTHNLFNHKDRALHWAGLIRTGVKCTVGARRVKQKGQVHTGRWSLCNSPGLVYLTQTFVVSESLLCLLHSFLVTSAKLPLSFLGRLWHRGLAS